MRNLWGLSLVVALVGACGGVESTNDGAMMSDMAVPPTHDLAMCLSVNTACTSSSECCQVGLGLPHGADCVAFQDGSHACLAYCATDSECQTGCCANIGQQFGVCADPSNCALPDMTVARDMSAPVDMSVAPDLTAPPDLAPGVDLAANCSDNIKDGLETDTDCGGGQCKACSAGRKCNVPTDCLSFVCTGGTCQAPTCSDSTKNGTETDVDCGGASCPGCATGQLCAASTDCLSMVCSGGTCAAPSCKDGVKNGSETDVDCGGSCSPCAVGKTCSVAGDCTSALCCGGKCVDGTTDANNCGGCGTVCPLGMCGAGHCTSCKLVFNSISIGPQGTSPHLTCPNLAPGAAGHLSCSITASDQCGCNATWWFQAIAVDDKGNSLGSGNSYYSAGSTTSVTVSANVTVPADGTVVGYLWQDTEAPGGVNNPITASGSCTISVP